jgi:hypothetical protein
MKNVLKIPLIVGMALMILVPAGSNIEVYGQPTQEQKDEAKLAYCYDLRKDISDDFGWFWQQTKRDNYNAECADLTGYIPPIVDQEN